MMKESSLFICAVAFLIVANSPSARAGKAAFDGSFIQSSLCGSWTDTRWQEEFKAMKNAGMHYLVIGPVTESTSGEKTRTLYPSSLPNTEMVGSSNGNHPTDMVDVCLRNAESAGIKVFIGIGMDDKWWSVSLKDSTWLYDKMEFDNKVCDELWHLYKKKYPDSFYGWYWAYEVANVGLTQKSEDVLIKAMNIQLDHLKSTGEDLPFMWCPFMNWRFGTPQEYEAMWKYVFAGLHTSAGDIFCPQDCVGAGGLKLGQVADWFSALRAAVDTKPGLVMWSDVETFDHHNWNSATIGRVVSQMKIEQQYVDDYITFAYCHYDSPYTVDPRYQETYLDYLKTGSLDTIPPDTPPDFTAFYQPDGDISLKWGVSTDNIGVCGYCVYRNDKLIFKTQIGRKGNRGTENNSGLTSLIDVCLQSNTSYKYKVRAYDFAGNLSAPTRSITVNTGQIDYLPNIVSAGRPYTVSIPSCGNTGGVEKMRLTDGHFADSATVADSRWEGFHDTHQKPRDVIVDLGRVLPVQQFIADYLFDPDAFVYLPQEVSVLVSADGANFRQVAVFRQPNSAYDESPGSYKYRYTLPFAVDARYVDFRTVPSIRWFDESTYQDEIEVRNNVGAKKK